MLEFRASTEYRMFAFSVCSAGKSQKTNKKNMDFVKLFPNTHRKMCVCLSTHMVKYMAIFTPTLPTSTHSLRFEAN